MNLQPLTTERLPGIPKLDKNQFISSYIQSQKANAKSYAEQGRTFVTSWNSNTTPKKAAPAPAVVNVGFATPVLIARPPRKENAEPVEKPPKKSFSKPSTKTADKPAAEKPPLPKKSSSKTTVTKKRVIEPEQDEDEAARLLERRERKRAKRAIVQPKEPSEADTASSGKPKQSKTDKEKKSKVPSGFALMHGFSATNVGKNRLTLKPPSNVGVFKKGKASLNTKTKQKPKRHGGKPFSELGFLRNTKKAPVSDTSSESDNGSVATSVTDAKKKKMKIPPTPCAPPQHASELSRTSSPPPKDRAPAESIVWDIESSVSLKSTKESKPTPDEGTLVTHVQGTVVVDARIPAWGQQDSAVESAPAIPSSPSLRPSESASHVGQHLQAPAPEASSRYFPIHAAAPQIEPQPEQPIKPASSVAPDPNPVEPHPPTELAVIPAAPDDYAPAPIRFSIPIRTRVLANQFPPVPSFPMQHEDHDTYFHEVVDDCEPSERYTPAPNEFMVYDSQSDRNPDDEAPLWADERFTDHIDYDGPMDWEDNSDHCQAFEEEYEDACCDAVEGMEDVDSVVYQDYDPYEDIHMEEVVLEEIWEDAPVYLEGDVYPEDASSCSDGADEARFSQGRALLLGLPMADSRTSHPAVHMSRAEQDVAKGLRQHWHPHRL